MDNYAEEEFKKGIAAYEGGDLESAKKSFEKTAHGFS